jgi:hypothetical protein
MARYRRDPSWIEVRFEGECARCQRAIRRRERAFFYPESRALYCDDEECGKAASRDFVAHAFDDESNRCM